MTTVVIDARQYRSRMQKLGILLQSSEITKVAGMDVLAFVADNFQSEGRSGAGGWKPLAASTIARRRKGGRAGVRDRILQDSGKLKQSFVPGQPGNVFRQFGGRGIDVGTVLKSRTGYPYPEAHEFGTTRIPQRKMLPTRDQAQTIAAKAIEAIIRERTRAI